ncbi:hypothetical protein EIP86_010677 [Pleurotus ostreatoroseus]|nr:hypothetical protein EIP86_010677 [Pleurotus ostreatoroseus]
MKTYPTRRHKPNNDFMDENTVTLPSGGTFGRSLRNYASMPGVRQIFNTQRPPLSRSQSTARLLRRLSAEWNASQAISGVTEDSVGPNWPAEVSREILRLTLGGSALGPGGKGLSAVAAIRRPHDSEGGGTRTGPGRASDNLASTAPGGLVEEGGAMGSMFVQDGTSDTLKRDGQDLGQPATLPKATGVRAYRKSILLSSSSSAQGPEAGPSSLQMTMASSPTSTPTRLRNSTRRPSRISSEPTLMQVPETPTKKGKRKAEEIDITPPDQRTAPHTTFVIPPGQRRAQAQSEPGRPSSVHAPSAYQRKRVRLSDSSPAPSVKSSSRPGSTNYYPADASSMASGGRGQHPPSPTPRPRSRTQSRAASTRSNRHSVVNTIASTAESKRDRRRTLSQVSIPVSAIVAPHPPSIGRSSMYHMRDPHRPVIQSTSWIPRLKSPNDEASPPHAWCFFIGFILFPLWWLASFLSVPHTRLVGGTDIEKGVTLDDPQVEHGAFASV